jgi:hypothetical protein
MASALSTVWTIRENEIPYPASAQFILNLLQVLTAVLLVDTCRDGIDYLLPGQVSRIVASVCAFMLLLLITIVFEQILHHCIHRPNKKTSYYDKITQSVSTK